MTLHRFGCAVEENRQLLTELVAIRFLLQHKQQIFLPVALQTWLGLESLNFTRGRIADCDSKLPIRRVRRPPKAPGNRPTLPHVAPGARKRGLHRPRRVFSTIHSFILPPPLDLCCLEVSGPQQYERMNG